MASEMNGMRSRTHSRVNTARTNAVRLGFVTNDVSSDDARAYGWIQEQGPEAIEATVNWQEEQR